MADEKPPKPAAPAGPPERDLFADGVMILFILIVISMVVGSITAFFNSDPIFKGGLAGLNAHSITLAYTRPMASLLNPINAHVIAADDPTVVLNDAGGRQIGTQKFGAKGTVIGGPVNVDGVNYYDVAFIKPPSGWVAEDSIAYQDSQPSTLAKVVLFILFLITLAKYLLWLLALAIVLFLARTIRKLTAIRVNVREKLYPTLAFDPVVSSNPKWERVLTHMESSNENDWRLAVIEADIMLSELLDVMHLSGDTIGDKLKAVEKSDFTTLDQAWEAHKVRNQIAHDGQDFHLSQREAKRVIGMYEAVFKEFEFI